MITDKDYDVIRKQYDQIRMRNRRIREDRINEVYDRVPGYVRCIQRITSLSMENAKSMLSGASSDPAYERKIMTLQDEARECLMNAGYKADYLDEIFECPKCKDKGYIEGEGKCECYHLKVAALINERSRINKVFGKDNFDHLSMQYYTDEVDEVSGRTVRQIMERHIDYAKKYVKTFDEDLLPPNILMYGHCGTGKTFLSRCIAAALIQKEKTVIYMSAIQLFDVMQQYKFSNGKEMANEMKMIQESDLLIIDDLGTELTNNFTLSSLFDLINGRDLESKHTILSTNLTISEIKDRYTERIASRLMEYKLMRFVGRDIRIIKGREVQHRED